MKVTSNKSVHFPKLKWGINKGQERELPSDKDAQKQILAHNAISEVGSKTTKKVDGGLEEIKEEN